VVKTVSRAITPGSAADVPANRSYAAVLKSSGIRGLGTRDSRKPVGGASGAEQDADMVAFIFGDGTRPSSRAAFSHQPGTTEIAESASATQPRVHPDARRYTKALKIARPCIRGICDREAEVNCARHRVSILTARLLDRACQQTS